MPVVIGTSGWQYADWRGRLYPPSLPVRCWLEHYAACFDTLEVNNAFYRLPERATFEKWAARTPPGFVVAVKASRYLTHIRRLREPEEPVARLMERAAGLGERLGPVLLQLPPDLPADLAALERTLSCFPSGVRVAVEPRHESWFSETLAEMLARFDAALCLADRLGPITPVWRTASFGYVRFHEGRASPRPSYGRRALERWGERLAEIWPAEADVYAFFNNDHLACAPRDAARFAAAVARTGRTASSVPAPREIRAG